MKMEKAALSAPLKRSKRVTSLTPEQIHALAILAADGAGVPDEVPPSWMTDDLPDGDFEPIARRFLVEEERTAEATLVGT